MDNFEWEVLGISETHWIDSGAFITQGYKILCSSNTTTHRAGVALILNKRAQCALLGYNPVSPRLISARFKTKTGAMTIIQIYAPNTADPEEKVDEFYDQLQMAINNTKKMICLLLSGTSMPKLETIAQTGKV